MEAGLLLQMSSGGRMRGLCCLQGSEQNGSPATRGSQCSLTLECLNQYAISATVPTTLVAYFSARPRSGFVPLTAGFEDQSGG
jgi:PKD repeat protein